MKTYLTIIFLSISTITSSQDIENRLSDEKVKKIVEQLCDDVMSGRNDALDFPKWELTMRKMAGYNGSSKDFSKYFNNFLNKYTQNLICPYFKAGVEIYPAHHLFKRILGSGYEELYDDYFFNFENGDINYNAYEIVDKKKETIVDWAEKWKLRRDANVADIEDIIEILIDEFGAKSGKDLRN